MPLIMDTCEFSLGVSSVEFELMKYSAFLYCFSYPL